jgi:hypothetical protein
MINRIFKTKDVKKLLFNKDGKVNVRLEDQKVKITN